MTDITELAQSLKAAAEKATPGRWEYYPGNTSIEYNVDSMDEDQGSIVYVDSGDFTQAQTDRNGEFIALANPANILALVEALEKAQAKADVYDMLRDDYGLREKGVGLADFVDWQAKRIAELEESHAQVIQSRDHYKRMTEEGLKQLAESRTVKLPDLRQIVSGDRYVWSDGVYNYSQDVKVALAAAGIKWEAE
ncbi:ead/Ea22-like family protein [Klebsiella pneumoniae]|uniref:ead/Ea22-like family protein n=1 Tax=Klebsiella pneumoniae TaxID=573 RepID=UPI001083F2B0|nr:ead/Ea22-like family protein [Klebsiella pneumoniae]VGD65657.1 RelE family toxin-antitoxin system [Klebsiella pneumoniae]